MNIIYFSPNSKLVWLVIIFLNSGSVRYRWITLSESFWNENFLLTHSILNSWNKLFLNLISENISLNEIDFDEINGISIAPKKEFNIVKIWLRNDTNEYKNLIKEIDPYFKLENSLYKKHELEY